MSAAAGEEDGAICFVGNMSWPPNVRAARYLINEIMPLVWESNPDATCYIVGKNPPQEIADLRSTNVIVTGEVPSLQDYYRRAQVIVAPLREGSGIKVKVVEALACGKAVVTTSIGAAGLNGNGSGHLIVADSTASFVDAIVRLLKNREFREKTAAAARDFAKNRLSPANTERQVRAILERLEG
jgi:glycosyltransferase involved in cell wall biosynthesis